MIFLWLISAPSIRFGYGVFLLTCYATSYFFNTPRKKTTKNPMDKKKFFVSIIFASIVGTPLFINYDPKLVFDSFRDITWNK